jgi:hypothetical protein
MRATQNQCETACAHTTQKTTVSGTRPLFIATQRDASGAGRDHRLRPRMTRTRAVKSRMLVKTAPLFTWIGSAITGVATAGVVAARRSRREQSQTVLREAKGQSKGGRQHRRGKDSTAGEPEQAREETS